jgi:hypothetical protein
MPIEAKYILINNNLDPIGALIVTKNINELRN